MTTLGRSLIAPRKLASVLDWNRCGRKSTVMALDFTDKAVGVCIGDHPSSPNGAGNIRRLDPIRLTTGSNGPIHHQSVADKIDQLAKDHGVCGVVVGWPLQPNGHPGKPCGKVLHTLETLVESRSDVLSKGRPFTLWDDRFAVVSSATTGSTKVEIDAPPDRWGRSVALARAPSLSDASGNGDVYRSGEAYVRPKCGGGESERASGILRHFMASFWEKDLEAVADEEEVDWSRVVDADSFAEEAAALL